MILTIILSLLGFLVLRFIYNMLIKPYILVQYYRKQGVDMHWQPIIGFLGRDMKNVDVKGCQYHYYMHDFQSKNKALQVTGGNLGDRVVILLAEPSLLQ